MAPIFTTSFYVGTLAPGANTVLYTVPLGYVAVMRDVEVLATVVNNAVGIEVAGTIATLVDPVAVGPYFYAQWQGRIATGAGNSFRIHNYGTATAYCAATGYVLRA